MLSERLLGVGLSPVWGAQLSIPVPGVNVVTGSTDPGEGWRHLTGGIWSHTPNSQEMQPQLPPSNSSTQSSLVACALFCPFPCTFSQAHPPATMSSLLYYWKETFAPSSWPFRGFFSPTPFILLIIGTKSKSSSISALLNTDIHQARPFLPWFWQTIFTNNTDTTQARDLHLWHGWAAGKPLLTSP